ncbi:hypothetical protein [Pantoea agglomerans]|jgi:hypothetical protein|uniref:hypothetical protein n=1 Tax=Enterobacter agglomerans TaxID=549 RepID=UPI00045C51E4|nr:hypothetical protein [Pantoea agglomerans]KDA93465.1 hypothetical protein T296_17500 [Pantoea agglomerans Eh318]KYN65798.1 hypothetical protein IU46_011795 [Pantoea agglomerans]WNK50153.1 hypothetical protein RM153_07405 [Pantoea agglomerans]
MKNNYEYIKRLKLSMQSALLGAVTENMRNIAVDIYENKILLYFFIDGQVQDDDKENISIIETEVIADFEDDFDIETIIKRIDCPEPIILGQGYSVFQRKEN